MSMSLIRVRQCVGVGAGIASVVVEGLLVPEWKRIVLWCGVHLVVPPTPYLTLLTGLGSRGQLEAKTRLNFGRGSSLMGF